MTQRRTSSVAKRDTRPVLNVLVVECDSDTLAMQGLSVAEALSDFRPAWCAALGALPGGVELAASPNFVKILRIHHSTDLLHGLAELSQQYRSIRTMLVIGHANVGGLQMTTDHVATWTEVGAWFSPFKPAQVALLACESGKPGAAQALGASLPSVRDVLAAPGLAVKPLWPWMSAWLLAKSFNITISPRTQLLLQSVATLKTKSVVYHWNRRELRNWSMQDDLVKMAFEHGPAIIEKMLRANP